MLLNDSCFRDISLTKQKILQRRHFISAGNPTRNSGSLLKAYDHQSVHCARITPSLSHEVRKLLSIQLPELSYVFTKPTSGTNPQLSSAEASLKWPLRRIMRASF
ncbi:MAG: hypothetical protein K0Q83_1866 [Deltaproteobacteria bacterium]|jgi:hypothetical protein|nr:hypothetical protein [Deltaproteobacteria bacterium]MCE3256952.1 hypothetical protein [Nitrobacter vulgaris]